MQETALLQSNSQKDDKTLLFNNLQKRQFSGLKEDLSEVALPKRIQTTEKPQPFSFLEKDKNAINPTEDLKKLNEICLKRWFIEKLYDHLRFEDSVKDCLVKVSLGNNNEDSMGLYKIGLVKGMVSRPNAVYMHESTQTDKYLLVSFDHEHDSEIAIVNISNKEIDENEAFKLLLSLKNAGTLELNQTWIEKKQSDLSNFLNYKFTKDDIIRMKDKKLTRFKSGTSTNLWEEKKLLEEQLNHLEIESFRQFEKDTYKRILELRQQVTDINGRIETEKRQQEKDNAHRFKVDKFMEYKSVCLLV